MYPNLRKKYVDVVTGGICPYGKIPDIITGYKEITEYRAYTEGWVEAGANLGLGRLGSCLGR